jgi:uncharacterized protein YndB with AHSA1/START domain
VNTQVIDEQILVQALPAAVWKAFTDPDITEKCWDRTRIESDWRKGSVISYRRGGEITDEHILREIVPNRLIEHSFRPVFGEFRNEAPSLVTILLTQEGQGTRVTVVHRDFPPSSKVYLACQVGWPAILKSIKAFLEA